MPEGEQQGAEGAENESGLVAKNRELLGELKAAKAKLKALDGLDADAAREALTFKEHADEEMAKKAGEFEKIRAKDREKYQRDLEAKGLREAKLTKALERRLVDLALSNAIRTAGGDPDYVLEKARPFVTMVESDDDWDVEVKVDGKPSSLDAVAKLLRAKYPRAFDGVGSSGSGTTAGTGGGEQALPDPNDPVAVGRAADAWIKAREQPQKR